MRTLVINLTRFGDLLQTQPVFTALKARGDEVGLMCLENFAPVAELLDGVDVVFPLPGSSLLAGLDRDWRESLATLWDFDARVREFAPQSVLNITATLPGRLLALMNQGAAQVGFGMDAFGFRRNTSTWAAFLLASSRNRGSSPFNLVDQFIEVAGLGGGGREYALAPADPQAADTVESILAEAAPPDCAGFVGFQLGASAEMRRWPIEHFARLGALMWERHRLCPVLFGTTAEAELGERFAAERACPAVSLIGRTGLTALAAALTRMRLLVTNDTGTMHLAAGMGTPICAVFLATAQPWDTGPYAEDCLCVEADMPCHPCGFRHECTIGHACRQSVRPEALYHYIESRLQTGGWNTPPHPDGPGARVWLTTRDADGFLDLRSLSGHEAEARTGWIRMQRHYYRQFLDNSAPAPMAEPPALSPELVDTLLPVFDQAVRLLFLLRQQADAVAQAPVAALKNRFLGNFERLTGLLADSAQLSVLGDMWREQSQEAGGDMNQLPAMIDKYHSFLSGWQHGLQQVARELKG